MRLRNIVSTRPWFDLILNTAEVANHPSTRSPSVQYCYFPEYFGHLESAGVHGLWELYYEPARIFYRSRVNRINRLLAVSNFTRDLVKMKWGRESTTLYPPCPIELYNDLHLPKENLVVTVGRMAPEKRMGLFLEIARRLPTLKFAIIGSVAQGKRWYFEGLNATAPDNLSIVVSPLRKVKEVLGRAKAYVHCAQNEHFGITIVEAMAAGCVPLVHDSGGPREIVSDAVGFKWNSIDEAVAKVSSLVEDDGLRRKLSNAAISRAQQFGPEEFESGMGKVVRSFSQGE